MLSIKVIETKFTAHQMMVVEKNVLYVQMSMHENNLAIAHDDGDMCCLVCRLLSIADVKVSKHIKILGYIRFNTFKSLDQYQMDTCKTLLNLRKANKRRYLRNGNKAFIS